MLNKRTSADFIFGTSIPTALFPGIGASILKEVAAKFKAILLSKASILLSLTPLGGLRVY